MNSKANMKTINVKSIIFTCIIAALALTVASLLVFLPGKALSGNSDTLYAQVRINEVMASNDSYAPTKSGEYCDWIELYNPTDSTVSLDKIWLSDNETKPRKCSLAGLSIEPKGYKLVYLQSGIEAENSSDEQMTAPFGLSKSGETLYLFDDSGIILSHLDIPSMGTDISYGYDNEDRMQYWLIPTPMQENSGTHADSQQELIVDTYSLNVTEFMSSNTLTVKDCDGEYSDWIELYNDGDKPVNLKGFSLTDDEDDPKKWTFKEDTIFPAGEYLLVFCSEKDKTQAGEIHTNFTLGKNGQYFAIYTAQNILCYQTELSESRADISCGLCNDSDTYYYFDKPTPGESNDTAKAYESYENLTPQYNEGVIINEVQCVTSSDDANGLDYIELYNFSGADVALDGYTLGSDIGEAFFTFKNTVIGNNEYLLIYCDGKNADEAGAELHADTKLSGGGERIVLSDKSGKVVDIFNTGKQRYGITSGRIDNDISTRWFFTTATPGAANVSAVSGYAEKPQASVRGGYVEKGTSVELDVGDDSYITYTTDGSKPTESSNRYNSPIVINSTTVLKFAAFNSKLLSSDVITETYLTVEKHTVPVVSLTGNPRDFTDVDTAMVYDEDSSIESPCHIEYFDENGAKAVEFNSGAAIFGCDSRLNYQKGIKLMLREKYGENEVNYPFFGDYTVDSFGSLLLRCGEDQSFSMARDEVIPLVIRDMGVDYQEVQPVALYINGKYWGLYYLRERQDASYLKYKYGYEKGTFDIVKQNNQAMVGTMAEYNSMLNYIRTHDLSNDEYYDHVRELIDTDSIINYWIVETFYCNPDSGNIKCYKTYDGGKWRWMLYDMDWAVWPSTWQGNLIYSRLLTTGPLPSVRDNTIMRNMLKNKNFRDKFITMYCYNIDTTFDPERTVPILNEFTDSIAVEAERSCNSLGTPSFKRVQNSWKQIENIFKQKPAVAYEQLKADFNLSDAELEEYKKAAREMEKYN